MSSEPARRPQHDVDRLFHARWSQRALSGEAIPDAVLLRSFEAARWAPSGGNEQPWRFIYSKNGSESFPRFLGFLNERNRAWAARASALILLLSRTLRNGADSRPLRSHSFDAGAAWSNFAHQAHLLGWSTRAMGGFDPDEARRALAIPPRYALEVVIAIGRSGDPDGLPEDLRAKERPSDRLPLAALVADGRFAFD